MAELDPTIPLGMRPMQQGNGLGAVGGMADTAEKLALTRNAMNQNQLFQQQFVARQALGQHYQAAIDPSTGEVNFNKLFSSMATDPKTAFMAMEVGNQAITRQNAQLDKQLKQLDIGGKAVDKFNGMLSGLLAGPDSGLTPENIWKVSTNLMSMMPTELMNEGGPFSPKKVLTYLSSLPDNPAAIRERLTELSLGSMASKDRIEAIRGQMTEVKTNNMAYLLNTNPQGQTSVRAAVPMGISQQGQGELAIGQRKNQLEGAQPVAGPVNNDKNSPDYGQPSMQPKANLAGPAPGMGGASGGPMVLNNQNAPPPGGAAPGNALMPAGMGGGANGLGAGGAPAGPMQAQPRQPVQVQPVQGPQAAGPQAGPGVLQQAPQTQAPAGAQPPAGPGSFTSGLSPGQTQTQTDMAKAKATPYGKMMETLSEQAQNNQSIIQRMQELAPKLKDIQPGPWKEQRQEVAGDVRGLTQVFRDMGWMSPEKQQELVDKTAGGNYTSGVEFNKFMVQNVMETLRQALAGAGGSRINIQEWLAFQKANPNLNTDLGAIHKIFDFTARLAQVTSDQLKFYGEYQGDPGKVQAAWEKKMGELGYLSPGDPMVDSKIKEIYPYYKSHEGEPRDQGDRTPPSAKQTEGVPKGSTKPSLDEIWRNFGKTGGSP